MRATEGMTINDEDKNADLGAWSTGVARRLEQLYSQMSEMESRFHESEIRLRQAEARLVAEKQQNVAADFHSRMEEVARRETQRFKDIFEMRMEQKQTRFDASDQRSGNWQSTAGGGIHSGSTQENIQVSWFLSRFEEMYARLTDTSSRMEAISTTCASELGRQNAEVSRLREMLSKRDAAEHVEQDDVAPGSHSMQIMNRDRLMNHCTNCTVIASLIGGFALGVIHTIPSLDEADKIGGHTMRMCTVMLFYLATHMSTFASLGFAIIYAQCNGLSEQAAETFGKKTKIWFNLLGFSFIAGIVCYISGVVLITVGENLDSGTAWVILFSAMGAACLLGILMLSIWPSYV